MRKPMLMVVNPRAGKTQGKGSLFEIVDEFHRAGYSVTVFPTQRPLDARLNVEELAGNYELVVSCGGDGTLNEVVSGVMAGTAPENRPKLAFIPVGTTNDLANSLNIPHTPIAAAKRFIAGPPMSYDIGSFNDDRYFVYVSCFGAFSNISYVTSQSVKNIFGHAAYIMEGVKRLPEIRPQHFRVEWEGGVVEDDFIFGSVVNSTSIAGIVKLKPEDVSLNDGLFDVFLVKNSRNLLDLQRVTAKVLSQNYDDDCLYFFKSANISFSSDNDVPWCLDGEDGGLHKTVTIKNLHNAITFMAGGY